MGEDKKIERLLRKLRSILSRAKHPDTPREEAHACFLTAERMMRRHHLTQVQVDESSDALHDRTVASARTDRHIGRIWWREAAAAAVCQNFRAEAMYRFDEIAPGTSGVTLFFIGEEEDAVVAGWVYQSIVGAIENLSNGAVRDDFARGFLAGLTEEWGRQRAADCTALALITPKSVKDFLQQETDGATMSPAVPSMSSAGQTIAGYFHGKQFGQKKRGVNGKEERND